MFLLYIYESIFMLSYFANSHCDIVIVYQLVNYSLRFRL